MKHEKSEKVLTIIADKVNDEVRVGMIYEENNQQYVKIPVRDFEDGLDVIYYHIYKKNRRRSDGK